MKLKVAVLGRFPETPKVKMPLLPDVWHNFVSDFLYIVLDEGSDHSDKIFIQSNRTVMKSWKLFYHSPGSIPFMRVSINQKAFSSSLSMISSMPAT